MNYDRLGYVLLANNAAMALYNESIEHLMLSNSFDFLVYPITDWNEVLDDLKEWDDYKIIDKITYRKLHNNLCIKLRELIKYL